MTNPQALPSDAHLQAALDAVGARTKPADVRRFPSHYEPMIAHARTIAKAEQLEAELAAMRAKYEPAPDPVKVEADRLFNDPTIPSDGRGFIEHILRRGIEMQQPFTREEAFLIARAVWTDAANNIEAVVTALTTPREELRKMGEG